MPSLPRTLACFSLLACSFFSVSQAQEQPAKPPSTEASPATEKPISTPLPAPSASARDLFSRFKDRLAQVRVLLNSANEQSALGSGFVVRDDGAKGVWVVTNYHVISSLAIDPEKYRLELRPTNERSVKARLVAVDVIHDLAVLHAEASEGAPPWPALALRSQPLVQGERVFSLGNPLELGFLISEGIYNGLVESRIYDQLLFSGALNSGMSGGPAIDDAGRVVGVNVATQRNGELLSFLVPVRYANELLERAWQASPRTEWRSEIARQLLAHQNFISSKLRSPDPASASNQAGFASQTLAGRTVPTLDGSLSKCWAGGRDGEKLRYQSDSLDCSLRAELFVRGGLYTGALSIHHVLLRNDKLATAQFLAVGAFSRRANSWLAGSSREMTANECTDEYVRGSKHTYRVALCLKGFRKFAGLYDFNLSAVQVDNPRERLSSSLALHGFSFENGQALSRLFLERLQ